MAAGDVADVKWIVRKRSCGFTYVVVLFALAIFSIGLAALGESWAAAAHREREAELVEVGGAYIKAIDAYYQRSPGATKTYPHRLDELLEDHRFVGIVRHLRHRYLDPVAGGEWALLRAADGGIHGVYSLSERLALHSRPLRVPAALPVGGLRYTDWKFIHNPDSKLSDPTVPR